jgi:hypothetical protein
MAFTGSYICTSFYLDLGLANIDTAVDTFRVALYDDTATLTEATTAYTATGELATAGGYTAGGATTAVTVSTVSTSNGPMIVWDFADVTWAAATFTARGAMLYDDTAVGNPAIAIMDFGANKTFVAADCTITFPAPTANAGFIVFGTVLSQ